MKVGDRSRLAVASAVSCGALAVAVFLNQLGSSSLFSDETYSWSAASGSLGQVFSRVRATENTPPLYYLILHVWIRVFGSGSVTTMRVLSVLGGLVVVVAVCWLGYEFAGSTGALVAGLAAVLSPLVLEYAQEIRAYVLVMATAALAAGAAVQLARDERHARRWLVLATVMSVATIWLHYSGILVALVVAMYVWTSPTISRRGRLVHAMCVLGALVIVAPLMVIQLRSGHQGGVAPYAKPTLVNLLRVLGTPFDGRFPPQAITYLCGAAGVLTAFTVLIRESWRRPMSRDALLLVAAAFTPVCALLAVNLAAAITSETTYYSLITRYTAVAAPFMLVAIGYAVVRSSWTVRVVLVLLVAAASVTGLAGDYSPNTRWPDLAGAFSDVGHSLARGDAVALAGAPAEGEDADYYLFQLRREHGPVVMATLPGLSKLRAARLWIVTDPGTAVDLSPQLQQAGWSVLTARQFSPDATVVLAAHHPAT